MNLPIKNHKNILFLGIGGGYDIMGAIPLLSMFPNSTHFFANYNPTNKTFSKFPQEENSLEKRLAQWLGKDVYCLPKTGVKLARSHIKQIVEENSIDAMVLVDGGVDSLMHGDEEGAGTWLDDTVTMIAADFDDDIPKVLACLGFGTELEENVCHYHALHNISELIAANAFYGTYCLTKNDEAFTKYQEACEFVWKDSRKSHIHTKVISAVHGLFGDKNLYEGIDAQVGGIKCKNFTSVLMSLYWFFDLKTVVKLNKMTKVLQNTNTSTDVLMLYRQMIDHLPIKKRENIPY